MKARTSSRLAAFATIFCAFGLGIVTGIGIANLIGPDLAGWHAGVKAGAEAQRKVDFAADIRNAPKPRGAKR